jgi:DNA-binding NarL/FixJ family response regulator
MNGYGNTLECAGILPLVSAESMATHTRDSIRIWIVDDNEGFRMLFSSLLNEEPGLHCTRQFSSPEAVLNALACEEAPDVILLDIEMGAYNGLDAIRPIKSLAKTTHVMMLTTFAGPDARERAFREGASDFMLKMWPPAEISMHIRQAMEFGSVAGLLTAYLGRGRATVERKEPETVEIAEKASLLERGLAHLRGLMKLSPS